MSAIVYLAAGAAAGWLADRALPGSPPYGAAAAALAGVVLSVLVALPLGDLWPHLFQVAVLPAAVGALVGAAALRLVLGRWLDRAA